MTAIGIVATNADNGSFARNASMNAPDSSAGRIFGAMPPPTYTPAVATIRSARLPASAPYAATNMLERLDALRAALLERRLG